VWGGGGGGEARVLSRTPEGESRGEERENAFHSTTLHGGFTTARFPFLEKTNGSFGLEL